MWRAETWIQVFLTPGPGSCHLSSLGSGIIAPNLELLLLSSCPVLAPLQSPFLPYQTFKSISLTQTFLLNSKHGCLWAFLTQMPWGHPRIGAQSEFPFLSSHGTSSFCSSIYLFIHVFGSAYKVSNNTPAMPKYLEHNGPSPTYSSGGYRSWTNTYIMSGGEMCCEENKIW